MSIASAAIAKRRKGSGRELDAPLRKQRRAKRARGYANREQQVDRDLDVDAAADALLDDDRHQRQRHRADHPEPACADRPDPLAVVGAHFADHRPGGDEDILVNLEPGRTDAGRRDEKRAAVAGEGDQHELRDDARRRAALGGGQAAEDEAADDRREGRALDQRVA